MIDSVAAVLGLVSAGPSDIVMMDATALAATMRSRQASCVEVMTAYLDHFDKLNRAGWGDSISAATWIGKELR